ncbi:hypothetical protein LTR64_008229 [Lithohypha guttulata]|uniref:Rhodopsin family protein n=1 Tax=Lithohypha guttulata TaxID=1690604 RepID=A0AAN7YAQ3_9EURO|nr:hypothetical protein LTR51_008381 [Lithohypha guttulata]KAK5091707.1 hypothetical protein LTR05_001892 [Lithohypha guttulata]
MAFCITFGTQARYAQSAPDNRTEFTKNLKGAENITAQCRNCGNWSARCITRWPWFTLCFIPILPLATHKHTEVACHVCRFHQDIKDRPDVQGMIANGGQGQQPPPQQGPNSGWGGPPPPGQAGGYYGQGGQGPKPQYH